MLDDVEDEWGYNGIVKLRVEDRIGKKVKWFNLPNYTF
jgi:hypothetical protein